MKYRKKPVVVDAAKFLRVHKPNVAEFLRPEEMTDVLDAAFKIGENEIGGMWTEGESLKIMTLEGVMEAKPGDWIIKGVKGELYPYKPDIFEKTYEPLTVQELNDTSN